MVLWVYQSVPLPPVYCGDDRHGLGKPYGVWYGEAWYALDHRRYENKALTQWLPNGYPMVVKVSSCSIILPNDYVAIWGCTPPKKRQAHCAVSCSRRYLGWWNSGLLKGRLRAWLEAFKLSARSSFAKHGCCNIVLPSLFDSTIYQNRWQCTVCPSIPPSIHPSIHPVNMHASLCTACTRTSTLKHISV